MPGVHSGAGAWEAGTRTPGRGRGMARRTSWALRNCPHPADARSDVKAGAQNTGHFLRQPKNMFYVIRSHHTCLKKYKK